MNNKGADQTACMRSLICALLFTLVKNGFSYDVAHFMSTG